MHIEKSSILKVSQNILSFIDLLGKTAESELDFKENQYKQELFALLKKIASNLFGFTCILKTNKLEDELIKTPLALCIRGIIVDFSIGVYFNILYGENPQLFYQASSLFSRQCAQYFYSLEKALLADFEGKTGTEFESELKTWITDFKEKFPAFFQSNSATWDLKDRNDYPSEIQTSDSGILSKIASSQVKNQGHFQYVFFLYKYFSQYQHYSSLSVTLLNRPFQLDLDYYYCVVLDLISSLEYFIDSLIEENSDIDEQYKRLKSNSNIPPPLKDGFLEHIK